MAEKGIVPRTTDDRKEKRGDYVLDRFAPFQHPLADCDTARRVHLEQLDSCTPGRSAPDNNRPHKLEVITPLVLAGMEEVDCLVFPTRREIRPLVQVATIARQSQVRQLVVSTVLASDNVLDVK